MAFYVADTDLNEYKAVTDFLLSATKTLHHIFLGVGLGLGLGLESHPILQMQNGKYGE